MTDPNVEAVREDQIILRASTGLGINGPTIEVAFTEHDDSPYDDPGSHELRTFLDWVERRSEWANDAVDRATVQHVCKLFEIREEDGADTLAEIIGLMDSLWTGPTRQTNAVELRIAMLARVFLDSAEKMLANRNAELEANSE